MGIRTKNELSQMDFSPFGAFRSGLKQQELGKILGHRKNYMSELINGVRPFSRDDFVIIHRLLAIELKDLIPTFIKPEMEQHIKLSLREIGKSKLKLRKKDLIVV